MCGDCKPWERGRYRADGGAQTLAKVAVRTHRLPSLQGADETANLPRSAKTYRRQEQDTAAVMRLLKARYS